MHDLRGIWARSQVKMLDPVSSEQSTHRVLGWLFIGGPRFFSSCRIIGRQSSQSFFQLHYRRHALCAGKSFSYETCCRNFCCFKPFTHIKPDVQQQMFTTVTIAADEQCGRALVFRYIVTSCKASASLSRISSHKGHFRRGSVLWAVYCTLLHGSACWRMNRY